MFQENCLTYIIDKLLLNYYIIDKLLLNLPI